jgi:hypothetical protein
MSVLTVTGSGDLERCLRFSTHSREDEMEEQKKIAVLVRDRQDEGIRMGVGITLEDDIVDVYILDRKVEGIEKNTRNISVMKELEMDLYTNCRDNEDLKFLSNEEIAKKLLEYDHILPY